MSAQIGSLLRYSPWLLLVVVGAGLLTLEATRPDLPADLQPLLFAAGTIMLSVGSVGLGRTQASTDAGRLVAPIAGPAFRRTFSLYRSVGSTGRLIAKKRLELKSLRKADTATALEMADRYFEVLEVQVLEQLASSEDAAAEWEALLPEQVAKLRQTATQAGLEHD